MAYVLGYIYADGVIEDVRKSSRTCYTAITSVDYGLLNKVRGTLSSNHKLYVKNEHTQTFPDGKKYLCRKAHVLRIGSKSMFDDLVKLGLTPRKSLTLKFPDIPANLLSYFVRGYFDGDGCIMVSIDKGKKTPSVKIIFTCGSLNFLDQLNDLLNKHTTSRFKNIIHGDHAYQLSYRKYDSLKVLKFMYKNLNRSPFLNRKYYKYKEYLETL